MVKEVVDGQQRLITLSLISIALQREAKRHDREALARSIDSTFLRFIDYDTDASMPRIDFTDKQDDYTYRQILSSAEPINPDVNETSETLVTAYREISKFIKSDIRDNPFKKLGKWADFLTNRLYFATFVHPTPDSAYQVFEVINTRGKDLTTADLLKNYLLSQVSTERQTEIYNRWQVVAKSFQQDGAGAFVQYIRHVVTLESGHVLPKHLYSFLSNRGVNTPEKPNDRLPPTPTDLLNKLEEHLNTYLLMIDPATESDLANPMPIKVFRALNDINVIAVRPILLALNQLEDGSEGMVSILKLVVKRVVVGSLGTGNVERRFGEAAYKIRLTRNWQQALGNC